jgi:membrane protein
VFPVVDVSVPDVLPGVFVAAFGWTILEAVFQAYVAGAGRSEVYGTLGAVLLVLTWLYLASLLVLVGLAVNVVLDDRTAAALDDTPRPRDYSSSD